MTDQSMGRSTERSTEQPGDSIQELRGDLDRLGQSLDRLRQSHDRLERRMLILVQAGVRLVVVASWVCLLLGILLPIASKTDSDGEVTATAALLTLGFRLFGDAADPDETSGGQMAAVLFGIGVIGLVIVALIAMGVLVRVWSGQRHSLAWSRVARSAFVLLVIGVAVLWLITLTALASNDDDSLSLAPLVLLSVGALLAVLAFIGPDRRRAR